MGFMSGVITGVALAAGAAAWYMSRSGERFRDQYRVDRKLGELGDQLEARTREIQSSVNSQFAEMRAKGADAASGPTTGAATRLDDAQASAAEAAAELAAEVEAKAAKVKKSAKDAAQE
jgi:gas vesicle protein